jgi:hypothetical protein
MEVWMTSQPIPVRPPLVAQALLQFFADSDETDSILGDLAEEFAQVSSRSGAAFARGWYWRQALKTVPHLFFSAFRAAPGATSAAVVAGFLLRRLTSRLPEAATFALIDRFHIYEHHFNLYLFLSSTGIDIAHVVEFFLIGCVVALLARGREVPPAIALATVFGTMALVGSFAYVIRGGDFASLWRLTWYLRDSLAVVGGACAIRLIRSIAPTQRAA